MNAGGRLLPPLHSYLLVVLQLRGTAVVPTASPKSVAATHTHRHTHASLLVQSSSLGGHSGKEGGISRLTFPSQLCEPLHSRLDSLDLLGHPGASHL